MDSMRTAYWYNLETKSLKHDVHWEEISKCLKNPKGVLWLDLQAPSSAELSGLDFEIGVDALCLESCADVGEKPPSNLKQLHSLCKVALEEFPQHLFISVFGIRVAENPHDFEMTPLHMFVGKNYVVTVHSGKLEALQYIDDTIRRGVSSIHTGAIPFSYEILDALVDSYMPVVDHLDHHLQDLEDLIESNPASDIVKDFFELRRTILKLRRVSLKVQDVFYWLSHRELALITKKETYLFKSLYDHLVRVVDVTESLRDILSGILSIHLSLVSNRLNDIMRLLTIFSAILLPLTFIAGIYGMNFEYIPELRHPYGYFFCLGAMLLITLGMLLYFRKKRWI
jgi:magnesium transporter